MPSIIIRSKQMSIIQTINLSLELEDYVLHFALSHNISDMIIEKSPEPKIDKLMEK